MNMQRQTSVNSGVRRKLAAMVAAGTVKVENLREDQRAALDEFYAFSIKIPDNKSLEVTPKDGIKNCAEF